MQRVRRYTVCSGNYKWDMTYTETQLRKMLAKGKFAEGTRFFRGHRRGVTYVIRGKTLQTWKGRVVVTPEETSSQPVMDGVQR